MTQTHIEIKHPLHHLKKKFKVKLILSSILIFYICVFKIQTALFFTWHQEKDIITTMQADKHKNGFQKFYLSVSFSELQKRSYSLSTISKHWLCSFKDIIDLPLLLVIQ